MKKVSLGLILIMFSSAVLASDKYNRYGPVINKSINTARSFAAAKAISDSYSRSRSGDVSGNQTLSIRNRRQAAGFGMGTIVNTAECQQGQGVAITLPLGGGGAQFTRTLDPCERRNWILVMAHLESIGQDTGTAIKDIYCASPIPAETDDCLEHKIQQAKNAIHRRVKLAELKQLEAQAQALEDGATPAEAKLATVKRVKIEDTFFNPKKWF